GAPALMRAGFAERAVGGHVVNHIRPGDVGGNGDGVINAVLRDVFGQTKLAVHAQARGRSAVAGAGVFDRRVVNRHPFCVGVDDDLVGGEAVAGDIVDVAVDGGL